MTPSVSTMTRLAQKSVKRGMNLKIFKPERCLACGANDVFAHQPDLNRPLAIKWLCARYEPVPPPGAVCYHAAPTPADAGADQ
ncbi:MAG: hypothetical protein EOQ64_15920 [Mesorhizobium sp.]|uniref:hypothetical protein n=1 Tax=Mesorhizobium sp. TaxID=1871066 RepID=UPI000FE8B208|nr:hypothetical protein [Mesorhizobium sp.]RWG55695.1 MAG: hypothetical protein EOQ64_15920 [Mesorhizobium sp.]RWH46825.1 MAG: hypothetical protein EOQ78_02140 [Mesorhizobium sp.]RWI25847.1 MAG: hypothetical protein EOQ94_09675 [Mesorhizobium sp.]